ncbi:MAG: nitrous oxide reductase accessory protein NosL [Desulfobacteraceae bacterium]|nr:MAG: nitrous oxide reductase accessory protein NosL [Desulfobacteraceae bacterium]
MQKFLIPTIALFFMAMALAAAADPKPASPGKKDKCPVCGMFVYKYPDWVGQISFADGKTFFFDGAKDLFKYYFNVAKYNPGKTAADIAVMRVTEYYDMQIINARAAFYVIGSDVFGPMGKEPIPFKTQAAAEEFKNDHGGTKILTFDQISRAVIDQLD